MADDERAPISFDEVLDVLAGKPDKSLQEVAAEAGLPLQILREVFDATGWANREAYDERDVGYAKAVAQLLDIMPLGIVVRAARTRYRAMTSIVLGDLATIRDHVVGPALLAGEDPAEVGRQIAGVTQELLPTVAGQLVEDYRRVLLELLDSDAVTRGAQGRSVALAVGFVDIVDYTALSGTVNPAGLDHVLSGFEDLVTQQVAATGGVILSKFVGDAAMLLASDPVVLAGLLLDLVDDHQRLAEAPRRAGLAYGPVLVRVGDFYGPVPNLAARLTDVARPWTLLADEGLEERLAGHFSCERVSKTTLPGIGTRRPLRLTRTQGDD